MRPIRLFAKISFYSLILACLTIMATSATQGKTLSLGIWPPLLEVMIQPGKSITQVYKIANPSESDVVLTSLIASFTPTDERGNIELITNNSQLENWFSFQNADLALGQNFVLKAGKEQEVVLKITVPAGTTEEDHYATLIFETVPNPFLGGQTTTQARVKIGANILLTVSQTGAPVRQAKIKEFSLANFQFSILNFQLVDSFDKPEFILRLQNTGQAFFKPIGAITINGWFNQKYTLDLLPENVLANSVRQIGCQKDSNPQLCVISSKFLLGRYTARVELGLDEANNEYQKEMIFWAIPAKLIIGVLTSLFLLYIVRNKTLNAQEKT